MIAFKSCHFSSKDPIAGSWLLIKIVYLMFSDEDSSTTHLEAIITGTKHTIL